MRRAPYLGDASRPSSAAGTPSASSRTCEATSRSSRGGCGSRSESSRRWGGTREPEGWLRGWACPRALRDERRRPRLRGTRATDNRRVIEADGRALEPPDGFDYSACDVDLISAVAGDRPGQRDLRSARRERSPRADGKGRNRRLSPARARPLGRARASASSHSRTSTTRARVQVDEVSSRSDRGQLAVTLRVRAFDGVEVPR